MRGEVDKFFALFKTKIELSQEFKDLIIWILKHEPSERPTIQQIRDSPWLKQRKSIIRENVTVLK